MHAFERWARALNPLRFPEPAPGDGGGSNNNPPPNPPPNPPKDTRVVFDTQDDFNRVITERVDRATRAKLRDMGLDTPADAQELIRLRAAEAERQEKEQLAQQNYEAAKKSIEEAAATRVKAAETARDQILSELRHDRIHNQLISAAAEFGASYPEEVATLQQHRVRLDDSLRPVVYEEDGKTPAFKDGKPVSVRQLMEGFLLARPSYRKAPVIDPSAPDGSGSRGGGQQGDTPPANTDPDIQKLEAAFKAAEEAARKHNTTANVTAAHAAKRALENAKREKANKK